LSTTARPETRPVGAANFVAADDIEGDGFWMAIEGEEPVHAIGADPDPFLGEEEERVDFEADNESVPDDDSDDWLCEMEEMAAAAITQESNSTAVRIELFDSGATRHISPYRDDFTTYSLLTPPLLLNTANQQRFQAIGTGSLRRDMGFLAFSFPRSLGSGVYDRINGGQQTLVRTYLGYISTKFQQIWMRFGACVSKTPCQN